MFDEFLDELRRRQAEAASGRQPRSAPQPEDDLAVDDDSGTPGDYATLAADPGTDDREADHEPEPITIGRGGRGSQGAGRGGPPRGPRSRRPVGGANDGAGFGIRRQVGTAVAVVLVLFVIIMLAVGLELWTDAIWYASVGYDAVFWTRLGAQVGLFVGGLVLPSSSCSAISGWRAASRHRRRVRAPAARSAAGSTA